MSNNPIKDNLQLKNGAQAGKRGMWVSFIIFMVWVSVIGLLISLVACKQSEPEIFVTKKLVECKHSYQSNAIGMPILVSTLKGISLYISGTSCEKRSNK